MQRRLFTLIFLLCAFAVAYSFYAEFYLNIEPCPLCIVERVLLSITAILSLLFAMHNPRNLLIRLYGLCLILVSAVNVKIAAHHAWLMSLPPDKQQLSCGMPLNVLYHRLPLNSFLHTILQGDAECGRINWRVFGMNPPIAVIILNAIVIILALVIMFNKINKKRRDGYIDI